MKHSANRSQKSSKLPIAWRAAEYNAVRASAADRWDDRVSENIFDIEDERAEIESLVHRTFDDAD